MALFGGKNKNKDVAEGPVGPPVDPHWVKSPVGNFYRFTSLDPEELGLEKKSGVFVIWHAGVRPRWVYVAQTGDLANALHSMAKEKEVMELDIRGGLYVTWSLIKSQYQNGVVRYLTKTMTPLIENPSEAGLNIRPVPVYMPGTEPAKTAN